MLEFILAKKKLKKLFVLNVVKVCNELSVITPLSGHL